MDYSNEEFTPYNIIGFKAHLSPKKPSRDKNEVV